jgi:hypothetical protein
MPSNTNTTATAMQNATHTTGYIGQLDKLRVGHSDGFALLLPAGPVLSEQQLAQLDREMQAAGDAAREQVARHLRDAVGDSTSPALTKLLAAAVSNASALADAQRRHRDAERAANKKLGEGLDDIQETESADQARRDAKQLDARGKRLEAAIVAERKSIGEARSAAAAEARANLRAAADAELRQLASELAAIVADKLPAVARLRATLTATE